MDMALVIGYLASACSVTSFVPQVIKVVRSGDTAAISARMYTVTVIGFALWSAFVSCARSGRSSSPTQPAFFSQATF